MTKKEALDAVEIARLWAEYRDLAHAMQSGVKFSQEIDPSDGTPKHLRTGINSALVNSSALAKLLIAKGVITELEYVTAMRDGMAAEVERYRKELSEKLGSNVTLI